MGKKENDIDDECTNEQKPRQVEKKGGSRVRVKGDIDDDSDGGVGEDNNKEKILERILVTALQAKKTNISEEKEKREKKQEEQGKKEEDQRNDNDVDDDSDGDNNDNDYQRKNLRL